MNDYINMLREVAHEANALAAQLNDNAATSAPSQLPAQELHNLRVRLSDLNRRHHALRNQQP